MAKKKKTFVRNLDYVIINGVSYENPIEAIAAVWGEILDMDSLLGNMLCEIEDLQQEVYDLKSKKKRWR